MRFYTLENKNGLKLKISDVGGAVSELHVPDRAGTLADITLGFDTVEDYAERNKAYFGAIIGRFGNRIGGSQFTLNGTTYKLAANNNGNHLHGGVKRSLSKVVWEVGVPQTQEGREGRELMFFYTSPDGEEGYPGNLAVTVRYLLTPDNKLQFDYTARTDRATPLNICNHAYFNLSGSGHPSVLGRANGR